MATITGTDRDDTLTGTDSDDAIFGGSSRDKLYGGAGNDTLDGGNGEDALFGGAGHDTLLGGQGQDTLSGDDGDDVLFGGDGDDSLFGGIGNDHLSGGQGQDWLYGGDGDDVLDGDDGPGQDNDDRLYGGAGNDILIARDVQDSLYGGTGDDLLQILKDGNLGTITADGGSDPDGKDFDRLDLKTGIARGDWDGVRIFDTSGKLIYDSLTPLDGQNYDTLPEDGRAELIKGRDIIGRVNFREIEKLVICFTPDALIATPRGEVRVAELKVGDLVMTRDNGMQPIVWIGQRHLSGADLARAPRLRPVTVRADAFGPGQPSQDMMLSPNHRLLIQSPRATLLFAETEVLAPAKHLVGQAGITQVAVPDVTYVHIMCARHEVVLSNGIWTESFQPGDHSLGGLGAEQRAEIQTLFPELATADGIAGYGAARKTLKKHESRILMA